ncbi:MAG TPA: hypothetical protein VGI10_04415 [Polyangiaceae bacterium]|jgi:hypothetical protein
MNRVADLTAHQTRQIAVLACCDPRTVRKYFDDETHSTVTARIEQALERIGRGDLVRGMDPGPELTHRKGAR